MLNSLKELQEYLQVLNLEDCLYFSEEETISAIIGYEDDSECLVYDYDKLVNSFVEHFRKYDKDAKSEDELVEEAIEWISVNTIRSLKYKQRGFKVYNDNKELVDEFYHYEEAENKKNELGGNSYIEEIEYKSPIIIHSLENFGY